jgi:hypothetical protein
MLIIVDDQQSLVPKWTVSKGLVNVFHQSFSFLHTVGWVLVVHETK